MCSRIIPADSLIRLRSDGILRRKCETVLWHLEFWQRVLFFILSIKMVFYLGFYILVSLQKLWFWDQLEDPIKLSKSFLWQHPENISRRYNVNLFFSHKLVFYVPDFNAQFLFDISKWSPHYFLYIIYALRPFCLEVNTFKVTTTKTLHCFYYIW